jgi:hypothetical protein
MSASEIFKQPTRWTTYEVEIHVPGYLVGGIPKDPEVTRAWLKSRLQLCDAEVLAIAEETIAAMEWAPQPTSEQLDELTDAVMAKAMKGGTSFKRSDGELVWEGRNLKAALKEAANALYPGTGDWPGKPAGTRKGLANWLIERVEVVDTYIPLGRTEPDIVNEQRVKHISGPRGKQSIIQVIDAVIDVKFRATICVLDDCIPLRLWQELWEYIERGGIGADRGRGDGRCELILWRAAQLVDAG